MIVSLLLYNYVSALYICFVQNEFRSAPPGSYDALRSVVLEMAMLIPKFAFGFSPLIGIDGEENE